MLPVQEPVKFLKLISQMVNTLFLYLYLKICVYFNDKNFNTVELNVIVTMRKRIFDSGTLITFY